MGDRGFRGVCRYRRYPGYRGHEAMSRFLICGLPRSRTAWFACATGAYHEPISLHGPGWISDWQDGEGVSDSGAAPYLPFILKTIKPRTLIVERPRAEVVTSLVRYFGRAELEDQIDALLDGHIRGLATESDLIRRVPFADLHSLEVVEAALAWLEVKPPRNLAQLNHFNIQADPRYIASIVQQKAA